MGVDTKAYWPNATFRSVFEWVNILAPEAALENGYEGSEDFYKTVRFNYKGEDRTLHLHDVTIDLAQAIKKYGDANVEDAPRIRSGLPDKSRGIMGGLGCWGRAVEIMKLVCYRFGGYVDENDSDPEDYYWVDKDERKVVRTVFEGAQ